MSQPKDLSPTALQLFLRDLEFHNSVGSIEETFESLNRRLQETIKDSSFSIEHLTVLKPYLQYPDIKFYVLKALASVFGSPPSHKHKKSQITQPSQSAPSPLILRSGLSVLLQIRIPSESSLRKTYVSSKIRSDTDNSPQTSSSTLTPWKREVSDFRKSFTKVWLALLHHELPTDVKRQVLLVLEDRVLPNVTTPLLFTDFLTKCLDQGGEIAILALGSMTHLILVHNGDYSNFYSKLYSLFHTPDFLNSPFAGNSLIQLDLCLSSSKVTDNICASFIKILCSHTLRAPSHTINGCLAIVHNVLIRHPPLQSMIGLRQTASLDSDQQQPDPFNPIEMNPEKTNARESSLWEISTLTSHFLPSISKLALTFSMLKSDLSIWDIRKYVTLSHKEFFVTNLLEYRKTKELPFEYLQSESYLSLPPQLTQYVPSGRLWKSGSTILDNGTVSVIPSISKLKRESSSSMSDHPNADSHEQSLEKRISIVCSPYEPLF